MSQISILILTGICDKERVKFLHCSPWWGLDLGRDPPRDLIFFKFKTIKNVPEQTKNVYDTTVGFANHVTRNTDSQRGRHDCVDINDEKSSPGGKGWGGGGGGGGH